MDRERERRQWEAQEDRLRESDERKRRYKEVPVFATLKPLYISEPCCSLLAMNID